MTRAYPLLAACVASVACSAGAPDRPTREPPVPAPAPREPLVMAVDPNTGVLLRGLDVVEDPVTGTWVLAGSEGETAIVLSTEPCAMDSECVVTSWMGCCPETTCEQMHPVNKQANEQRLERCDPSTCPAPRVEPCRVAKGSYYGICVDRRCAMRVNPH